MKKAIRSFLGIKHNDLDRIAVSADVYVDSDTESGPDAFQDWEQEKHDPRHRENALIQQHTCESENMESDLCSVIESGSTSADHRSIRNTMILSPRPQLDLQADKGGVSRASTTSSSTKSLGSLRSQRQQPPTPQEREHNKGVNPNIRLCGRPHTGTHGGNRLGTRDDKGGSNTDPSKSPKNRASGRYIRKGTGSLCSMSNALAGPTSTTAVQMSYKGRTSFVAPVDGSQQLPTSTFKTDAAGPSSRHPLRFESAAEEQDRIEKNADSSLSRKKNRAPSFIQPDIVASSSVQSSRLSPVGDRANEMRHRPRTPFPPLLFNSNSLASSSAGSGGDDFGAGNDAGAETERAERITRKWSNLGYMHHSRSQNGPNHRPLDQEHERWSLGAKDRLGEQVPGTSGDQRRNPAQERLQNASSIAGHGVFKLRSLQNSILFTNKDGRLRLQSQDKWVQSSNPVTDGSDLDKDVARKENELYQNDMQLYVDIQSECVVGFLDRVEREHVLEQQAHKYAKIMRTTRKMAIQTAAMREEFMVIFEQIEALNSNNKGSRVKITDRSVGAASVPTRTPAPKQSQQRQSLPTRIPLPTTKSTITDAKRMSNNTSHSKTARRISSNTPRSGGYSSYANQREGSVGYQGLALAPTVVVRPDSRGMGVVALNVDTGALAQTVREGKRPIRDNENQGNSANSGKGWDVTQYSGMFNGLLDEDEAKRLETTGSTKNQTLAKNSCAGSSKDSADSEIPPQPQFCASCNDTPYMSHNHSRASSTRGPIKKQPRSVKRWLHRARLRITKVKRLFTPAKNRDPSGESESIAPDSSLDVQVSFQGLGEYQQGSSSFRQSRKVMEEHTVSRQQQPLSSYQPLRRTRSVDMPLIQPVGMGSLFMVMDRMSWPPQGPLHQSSASFTDSKEARTLEAATAASHVLEGHTDGLHWPQTDLLSEGTEIGSNADAALGDMSPGISKPSASSATCSPLTILLASSAIATPTCGSISSVLHNTSTDTNAQDVVTPRSSPYMINGLTSEELINSIRFESDREGSPGYYGPREYERDQKKKHLAQLAERQQQKSGGSGSFTTLPSSFRRSLSSLALFSGGYGSGTTTNEVGQPGAEDKSLWINSSGGAILETVFGLASTVWRRATVWTRVTVTLASTVQAAAVREENMVLSMSSVESGRCDSTQGGQEL
ncbi:hypothetical protein BC939DRAFT_498845 [Gamsiella multidivaricata]|uniref:uncharacterized protein n=1 Tax=Gamsiella multidivaricata TaxID=101098 RepID=UPI00221FAF1B|nr:uncharacterized protein BC939DRAFT_498845 [Gamsiella multidivaricata]KAI7831395.1 hypothetical protein BC939DRAFT_498845 [Gamsiella multidivaricata]